MKIITIGDLHGSVAWRKVQPEKWDRIIFMGDYVDSFDYSDDHILNNLKEVISFKKKYLEKVVLLWGNHDLAYYFRGVQPHACSGFRRSMMQDLHKIFTAEEELFLAAFQAGNHLWSHAGVVGRWFQRFIGNQVQPLDYNLSCTFNRLFRSYYLPLFHVSDARGGWDKDGGIFWADLSETWSDPPQGYQQIIGHTKVRRITRLRHSEQTTNTYVDCLESKEEFLELEVSHD